MQAIVGAIIAGLVQFFASRAGSILAGLGLTYATYTGMTTMVGFVVADVNTVMSSLTSMSSGTGTVPGNLGNIGLVMLQAAAYCGLFDSINIVISGVMAIAGLMGTRFVLARLAS